MTELSGQPIVPAPAGQEKSWRCLLVDDHAMVREALSHMLERLDGTMSMCQAKNVSDALEILRADRSISVLLLDYHMPGMEGGPTLELIKAEFPHLRVGIITGYVSSDQVELLIAAGAIGVFPKAMSGPSLLMALKLALAGQAYVPWSGDLTASEFAPANRGGGTELPPLSNRQSEVLVLVAAGLPNKEIARRLGLSEVTIKIHVAALCRKFSAVNRTQLATAAVAAGVRRPDA